MKNHFRTDAIQEPDGETLARADGKYANLEFGRPRGFIIACVGSDERIERKIDTRDRRA